MGKPLNLNKKKVLITGGAGFVGSNLALYIQNHFPKARVIVYDSFRNEERFSNGNLKSFGHFKNLLSFNGEVIYGDITSPEFNSFLKKNKFDVIFHEAAISDTTVTDQSVILETNVNPFQTILDVAVKQNIIVVYASSGSVYGSLESPQTVGIEAPTSGYGFSKLSMDKMASVYRSNHPSLKVTGLRYFNVYGPNEFFKDKTSSMILQFGLQLLKGDAAKLFEGSDNIRRDFIYIDDVVQANIAALSGTPGVYNVGTGVARSFEEIVTILKKELNINRENILIPNPFTKQYQFHTQAEIKPTIQHLGYKPTVTLEEGIKRYIPTIQKIYSEIKS